MAEAGWLGIAMPEEYGGAGLGITEAALLMQTVAESGAALQGASAIHLNIFGPNPIVVFGTEEQKKRILPDIIKGKIKGCFAVTEPDAGLNTTALDTKAERDGNGYIVHGKEDLHHDGLGRRQDAADRPHHAQGEVQAADRRAVAVLHRLRPLQDRGHRDRQDGPQGDRHQPGVHRRPEGAARGPHRRGRQGLPLPAARAPTPSAC